MNKSFLSTYKTHLLLSLTVSIVLIAIKVAKDPLTIAFIIVGSLLGTFVLDLDYFIHAYFLEPTSDFSINVRAYIQHKDFIGVFRYINLHKDDVKEKVLHSVLFQIVWVGVTIFGVSASESYLVKAIALSTYINSLYRFAEYYVAGRYEEWFWSLKQKPTKRNALIYTGILIAIFIYTLTLF